MSAITTPRRFRRREVIAEPGWPTRCVIRGGRASSETGRPRIVPTVRGWVRRLRRWFYAEFLQLAHARQAVGFREPRLERGEHRRARGDTVREERAQQRVAGRRRV